MTQEQNDTEHPAEESEDVEASGNKFLWPRLNTPEWVSALASVGAVIVAIASVVVAIQTRVVLNKQLSEMQSGARDTEHLVVATQKLADRSKDQAVAMDKLRMAGESQAKSTGDLKDITKSQADKIAGLYGAIQQSAKASADAADATRRQAAATQAEARSVAGQTDAVIKSLGVTQDMAAATRKGAAASERANDIASKAFVASERAWVGVDTIQVGQLNAGQDLAVTVNIRNTGRSPALNMHGQFWIAPLPNGAPMPVRNECIGCSSATVLPNGSWSYNPTVKATVLTTSEIAKIKSGGDVLAMFGRLDYRDDTGSTHTTWICSVYNITQTGFSACSNGNDAN